MATVRGSAFVHVGIQLRHRRVERLDDEPSGNPIDLLEQYIGLQPEWMSHPRRRCKGKTEEFFGGDQALKALECEGCPVQHECLLYALETGEKWGVWGGATEEDRRRMKKANKRWK